MLLGPHCSVRSYRLLPTGCSAVHYGPANMMGMAERVGSITLAVHFTIVGQL
jgi:hypothetical protein